MRNRLEPKTSTDPHGFDYSTPEAQAALEFALGLVMEIRDEEMGNLASRLATAEKKLKTARRRVSLYERSLGLAVIPLLLRRRFTAISRKTSERRQKP